MMIGYVLLALGIAIFVLSFVLPARSEEEKNTELSEEMIREMVVKEVESAKGQSTGVVDETIHYAIEKTERSMDRLTNEKIMAVNEYSDTGLSDINKNHQEVVFLYDMLNDKHENLKNTVSEVEKTASEVKQAVRDAELTAKETSRHAMEAKEAAMEANANAAKAADVSASYTPLTPENEFVPGLANLIADIQTPVSDVELNVPESSPAPTGRMSAIDRLRMVSETSAETAGESSDTETDSEPRPQRKRRTTKPKVREEAVILGSDENEEAGLWNNGLEIVKSEESSESFAPRDPSEVPNLNLGDNPMGYSGGRNKNEQILELHAAGKSNMAIAKELGLGIGEVKLVIDLFEGM